MGTSQSIPGSKEDVFTKITNLESHIENDLARKLQDAINNTLINNGSAKAIHKKRSEEILEIQKKFSDYKKLINEVRTLSTTNSWDLWGSLVEYKQTIEKLTKDIKDLEDTSSRNLIYQKSATDELAREIELKQKAESDLLLKVKFYKKKCKANELEVKKLEQELKLERKVQEQMKLKIEQQFQQERRNHESNNTLMNTIDSQTRTIKQLEREQDEKDRGIEMFKQIARNEEKRRVNMQMEIEELKRDMKVQEQMKLNIEQQFQRERSNHESSDILMNTIDTQIQTIKQLERQQNEKDREIEKFKQIARNEEKRRVNMQMNMDTLGCNYTKEKDNLLTQLVNLKCVIEHEKAEKATKIQEINTVSHKHQLEKAKLQNMVESTNKLHQDTSIALENTKAMLIQYKDEKEKLLKDIQLVKDELEKEKVKNKTLEEPGKDKTPNRTTKCEKHEVELQQQREEIKKLEGMYKSVVDFQVACQQTTTEVTKMVEDKLAEETKHRKQIQGQLYSLQRIHNNLKAFCRNDLRQRKDFLKEVAKVKKEAEEKVDDSGQVETAGLEGNASGILNWKKHNSHTENLLEEKTREIAVLKKELKMKENEIKKFAAKERQSSRKEEMLELHEQFMESLKSFNDP